MRYTVLWLPGAESELAQLWLDPATRGRVATAANEIDGRLRDDPQEAGESRDAGKRILVIAPLAVTFAVHDADRTVIVREVWRIDRQAP